LPLLARILRWGGGMKATTSLPPILPVAVVAGLVAAIACLGGTVPASASETDALERVDVQFQGNGAQRTLVEAVVAVPVQQARCNAQGFFNLRLNGEVQVDGRRYDRFGYHYDVPCESDSSAPLALSFQRQLRPGSFRLLLEVEDLQSGKVLRAEQELVVPRLDQVGPPVPAELASADGPRGAKRHAISILAPPPIVTGHQRFTAVATGEGIASVTFLLDGQEVLSRSRPPFEAGLFLGREPRVRTLRVEAHGAHGEVLASHEVQLNTGEEKFAIQLAEPRPVAAGSGEVWVSARVEAPAARVVEQVEVFVDQERVAVWREAPWQGPVRLPTSEPAVLKAVARLDEGAVAEDAMLLNVDGYDSVRVDLVELSTSVTDHRGRAAEGLRAEDFRVVEDGVEQQIERFTVVRDAPVHAALVVDASSSMGSILASVQRAAQGFLSTLLTQQDRALLVTFGNAPQLRVPLTDNVARLANGLELIEARGATALYDSLVFTLGQLQGIRGQRALVVLSDGLDNRSRHSADDVLELARRAAVTIFTIGIEERGSLTSQLDRETLRRLAEESGGRSFFIHDPAALDEVYASIERDLRSRYLLSYYSSNTSGNRSFRVVDVRVDRPRLAARTIRGYYP
jgi:Ca-activated chloride channel homolog